MSLKSALSLSLAITLCSSALWTSGCFRYTPSRREMTNAEDSVLAGPEAFEDYQKQIRERLNALLKARAPLALSQNEQSYPIGVGDVLKLDVFGFSDLSGELRVSENGTIGLPLVGSVPAKGKSIAELEQLVTYQYRRYVRNPKVRLTLNDYNAHRVSVVGSVVKPGWYPLKRVGYPLTELLAEVGGIKDNAGSRIYLIPAEAIQSARQVTEGQLADSSPRLAASSAGRVGVEIQLEELNGTLDKPPLMLPLVPGDTVIVPEAGQFRVAGEVENPGSFPISHRSSTLSGIASAGGFTYAANVNEVEVIRDIGAGKKASTTIDLEKVAFHGSPDLGLRDGDVIVVPSSPGRFRARQLVEAFRTILRGGVSGTVKY